jgi:hypothetical protein
MGTIGLAMEPYSVMNSELDGKACRDYLSRKEVGDWFIRAEGRW